MVLGLLELIRQCNCRLERWDHSRLPTRIGFIPFLAFEASSPIVP